ncbi:N-acetylmuramoyl-L-alanine amidase [Candidatus Parcubacteria bacterium]|nr:N-acetylmuramoyl-L-alanine amidase [Candidatus Parcubacteria bacterium]
MKIKYIIIHHSAVSREKNSEQFKAINNYHKRKGWGMIGYHFLIEPNGRIRVGRSESQSGAHCIGRNYDSLGICLTGNFDIEDPTKEQEKSLKILLMDLLKGYKGAEIKYHRDFAVKTCPGRLIADDWAKNLINNNNTSMIIKKENEPMLYVPIGNKLIHFNTDWPTYAKNFESEMIIELSEKEFEKFEVITNVTINNKLIR